MEALQNIDPAHLPIIGVGCAALCIVAFVIAFALQAVSSIFEVIFGLVELLIELLQGGPVAWCGCILLIAGALAFAGAIILVAHAPESCAAHPTRFCQWFGFLP